MDGVAGLNQSESGKQPRMLQPDRIGPIHHPLPRLVPLLTGSSNYPQLES